MTNRLIYVAIVLSFAVVSGCGESLDPIDSMTVFSLDGTYNSGGGTKPKGAMFHDYPVLGKTDIASASDRIAILRAVHKGIATSDGQENKCFWPHHGVQLQQSGKTIEYLICFRCLQLEEYVDGRRSHKPTTTFAQETLDEHLDQAGVTQQKPAH
jgi:hypothetical protein